MKQYLAVVLAAFILGVGLFAACGSQAQTTGSDTAVSQDVKKGEDSPEQQKEAYQGEIEKRMKELDQKWTDVKKKAGELKKDAEAEAKPLLEDLGKKRDEVSRGLEELKASGEKAWKDVKPKIEKAMDDLKKGLDKAISRFK